MHSIPFVFMQKPINLVHSEWYVNHLQMLQRGFAVPSTHTRIWLANHLRAVHEPLGSHVCTGLNMPNHLKYIIGQWGYAMWY